MLKIFICQELS